MGRSRHGHSRGPTIKRQVAWVRTLFKGVSFDDDPVVETDLVAGVDWTIGSLNEKATLRRIRAKLGIRPPTVDFASVVFMAIYRTDVDNIPVDPDLAAILAEDLLFMESMVWPGAVATHVEAPAPQYFDVDVKAMRRIGTDEVIRMGIISSTAGTFSIDGYTSLLISRGRSD